MKRWPFGAIICRFWCIICQMMGNSPTVRSQYDYFSIKGKDWMGFQDKITSFHVEHVRDSLMGQYAIQIKTHSLPFFCVKYLKFFTLFFLALYFGENIPQLISFFVWRGFVWLDFVFLNCKLYAWQFHITKRRKLRADIFFIQRGLPLWKYLLLDIVTSKVKPKVHVEKGGWFCVAIGVGHTLETWKF